MCVCVNTYICIYICKYMYIHIYIIFYISCSSQSRWSTKERAPTRTTRTLFLRGSTTRASRACVTASFTRSTKRLTSDLPAQLQREYALTGCLACLAGQMRWALWQSYIRGRAA
ncbi:hypothetical protein T492DRAFT_82709 [Pavlovales sp. CCMP2436]|nr:hypothetical protein T492DRAFT_82709 [Pavlovales sp. CCMP2436]